jgi:DNA processing protein
MSLFISNIQILVLKLGGLSVDTPRGDMRAGRAASYPDTMDESVPDERTALVALLQTRPRGMRWSEIATEVLEAGSALEVWHRLVPATLVDSPGQPDALESAVRDVDGWTSQGCTLVTILDGDYPVRLRGIHQAPPVLFARGTLVADDSAVSVVGSRKASDRGLAIATDVARGLVSRGVTVVAGLALGVDTAAHRAALAAGGRTVGIIGTGINRIYPAENRDLHEEIAARGLLLSQFWPDAPPQQHNFLMRNATMSGYGLATVVVEAGETSGARAQARMAVEHGRPVILTEMVVERNEWAQALIDRPGIHVASGLRSLLEAVDRLIEERTVVGDELRRFVSA